MPYKYSKLLHPMSHQQPELPIIPENEDNFLCQMRTRKIHPPCRNPLSSTNMPLFMDNLINSVPLSTKSPIFMDNSVQNPLSSMNTHLFMDNLVPNPLSSMNMPLFMDKTSNLAALSIKKGRFHGHAQDFDLRCPRK